MKITGIILIIVSVITGIVWISSSIYAGYEWDNTALSNWNLSDKASTLAAKANYIDKFIVALKSADLADNDALIYKTADNNCANNIEAISTLKQRLDEIKGMDVSSFQYQQAIQQITAQEQGEGDKLIGTLKGCWMKTHHYFLWNGWFDGLYLMLFGGGIFIGFVLLIA